jgi:phosphopantothenate synthetase
MESESIGKRPRPVRPGLLEVAMNPGDYKGAHGRIKQLYKEGKTEILYHAQLQMAKREADMNDVANVIRYGRRIVEHSKPMEQWRYVILGKAVDGETTKCVVEINKHLKIVTVI